MSDEIKKPTLYELDNSIIDETALSLKDYMNDWIEIPEDKKPDVILKRQLEEYRRNNPTPTLDEFVTEDSDATPTSSSPIDKNKTNS